VVAEVAAPRSALGTAFCTARRSGTMMSPIPMPASSMFRHVTAWVVLSPMWLIRRKAIARHTIPLTTGQR
jgi:hypothetical protein